MKKVSWSNVLAESQLLTSLHLTYLKSPHLMVTLLYVMFRPIDITVMCQLNDV
jgi:hypothetical protein